MTRDHVHLLRLKTRFIGPILFAGHPLARDLSRLMAGRLSSLTDGFTRSMGAIRITRTLLRIGSIREPLQSEPSPAAFFRPPRVDRSTWERGVDVPSASELGQVRFQLVCGWGGSFEVRVRFGGGGLGLFKVLGQALVEPRSDCNCSSGRPAVSSPPPVLVRNESGSID